jgi:hypothetical protein
MADICDRAGDAIDQELALRLAVRKPVVKPKGYCLWCHEPVKGVYCSDECRAYHTQYQLRHG